MKYNVRIKHFPNSNNIQVQYFPYFLYNGDDSSRKRKSLDILNKSLEDVWREQYENFEDIPVGTQFVDSSGKQFIKADSSIFPFITEPQFVMECGDDDKIFDVDYHKRYILNSMKRTKKNIYDIARSNIWTHFATFTFDGNVIDRENPSLCLEKFRKWLNNFKSRYSPDLKYLFVVEYHKNVRSIHMHALLSGVNEDEIVCGVYTDFEIKHYSLGISDISAIRSLAAVRHYITKYITKDILEEKSLSRFRYFCSKGLERPSVDLVCSSDINYEWYGIKEKPRSFIDFYEDNLSDFNVDYVSESSYFGKRIRYIELSERVAPESGVGDQDQVKGDLSGAFEDAFRMLHEME